MSELITLTASEAAEIKSQGYSLKTLKAGEIKSGMYNVSEISITVKDRDEIRKSLEESDKDASWTENLPSKNIAGRVKLIKGDKSISVYLNNALFNLMLEQSVVKESIKEDKVLFEVNLKKQLKIS